MARFRKQKAKEEQPLVKDDFIYNISDDESSGQESDISSDTPDEAIRKLRGRKPQPDSSPASASSDRPSVPEDDSASAASGKIYGSGIMLDDNLQPITDKAPKNIRQHPVLRGILISLVTLVLLVFAAAYIFHRISPGTPGLGLPEQAVSSALTPVQAFFSGISETVFGYFRSMKLRANIEQAYNDLRAENEQLVYKAMLADELQNTLSQYEDLSDEIKANKNMKPLLCTIIGKSDENYFSTFTISKGSSDGIEKYMAVTISGALVGYTERVDSHSTIVRTIIDSEASIAGLIQSSRDQGTVRGTLGIDGSHMCRMYYLPDDNLPRPGDLVVTSGVGMSFPKGIPIGVVRESTREVEANKQYIVLEPKVDFEHLEYVIVLLYQPPALAVEGRESGESNDFVPVVSARPSPEVPEYAASLFSSQDAEGTEGEPTPEPTPTETPTPTPTPSPTPTPTPSPTPDITPLEYQVVQLHSDPTPTPTPTIEPSPTPYIPPDPEGMTFEE